MPDNIGVVWFWIDGAARERWSFPLDIGDSMEIYLEDLKQLNFFFVSPAAGGDPGDKVALIYEVEK